MQRFLSIQSGIGCCAFSGELNTHMRIDEVISGLRTYTANVRAKSESSNFLVNSAAMADGFAQVRAILRRQFGEGNVFTIHVS